MERERENINYIWCHAQLIDYGGQYYNIREAILKLLEFQAPLAQCCHVSADIAARQTEFLDLRRLLQRQQHRLLHVEQPCRGGASICWRELRWKCETISKKSMGWKHSSYSSIRGWGSKWIKISNPFPLPYQRARSQLHCLSLFWNL